MSPWVLLTGTDGSMTSNDDNDVIGSKAFNTLGRKVLEGVSESQLPYLEPISAPESWFEAIDTVAERVLITAGTAECMWDATEKLAIKICNAHKGATFRIQENGVHNDPYFDFLTKEKKLGKLTPQILEWLAVGFKGV